MTDEQRVDQIRRWHEEGPCGEPSGHIGELLAYIDVLTAERDAAVAHDTQPYPTAWAYDQVCRALHKAEAERDALRAAVVAYHNDDHDPESIERDNKWLHVLRLAGVLA